MPHRKESQRGVSLPLVRTVTLASLFLCATLSASAANYCAPPNFNVAPSILISNIGSSPRGAVAGDFNGDGRTDLAVVTPSGAGFVTIMAGAGDGSFGAQRLFPAGTSPEAIASGDFNGDGVLDLAISRNSDRVSVLLGHGDGTFGAPSVLNGGGVGPTYLTSADLNADGRADLILLNINSSDVSIFLATGAGGFSGPTRFPAGSLAGSVAVGDFNGDAKSDIAVAGNNLYTLLGDGNGSFGAPTVVGTGAAGSGNIAVADFNQDGKSDLVTGSNNQISVLFGTGTGGFGGRTDITIGSGSRFVIAGDFNRDGKADIVSSGAGYVSVLTGDGAGHFSDPAYFLTGNTTSYLVAADLNSDGENDLIVVDQFGSDVIILLGKGGAKFAAATGFSGAGVPAAADFNGDGKTDIVVSDISNKSVSVLLGDGHGGGGTRVTSSTLASVIFIVAGDFNGDGKPDIATLGKSLTNSTGGLGDNLSVMLGDGTGSFGAPTSFPVGSDLSYLLVADFNKDGKSDLVVSNATSSKVSILAGNGAGGFSGPVTFSSGPNPAGLAAGDFNGDGKNDLAVVNESTANVSILPGDGAGSFSAPINAKVGSNQSNTLATADFNGDGRGDLAVVHPISNTVSILIGNGDGTFNERAKVEVGLTPLWASAGDFNGDGAADLAVSAAGDGVISLLLGDGAGSFTEPYYFYGGGASSANFVADLNGDGKSDLIVQAATLTSVLLNTSGTGVPTLRLCPLNYEVNEGVGSFQVVVSRGGDASGTATVHYSTSDGIATDRSDYTAAVGTLRFSPGEVSKTFTVFITDDTLAEPEEFFSFALSAPTGAKLDDRPAPVFYQPTSLNANVVDNDLSTGPNPVAPDTFNAQFFVRQHYHDFLNRDPDPSGLAFWTNEITSCGSDTQCAEVRRINVSAAFFLSIEFQQTGYLVYKTYGAAFGSTRVGSTVPLTLAEFLPDTQAIGQNVVVGSSNWEAKLEANKASYFDDFVTRKGFTDLYPPAMTAAQYVDALNLNAGGALSTAVRDKLVADLTSGVKTRAQTLRAVAEDSDFSAAQLNRAFVLMQYFGYLRRDPNDLPDSNFAGYNFWLSKLNQFHGNFIQAEMVKAFIQSDEYRHRFGP